MPSREFTFYSDGLALAGELHSPDGSGATPRPAVVVCSGLHGLKQWVPARFRDAIVAAGWHAGAFDYRGFGASEGERGRMLPEEEIRDATHFVTWLRTLDDVDPEGIVLVGWGLGTGIAIETATRDARIRGVACLNGAGHYGRTVRDAVPWPMFQAWTARLSDDRVRRVTTGTSERVDFRAITHPGLTDAYGTEVGNRFNVDLRDLAAAPHPEFTLETCDAYIDFRPEDSIGRIAPRPVLVVHGAHNDFMPIDEAHHLFHAAGEPRTLHTVEGAGHLDMIVLSTPAHRETMAVLTGWIRQVLSTTAVGSPTGVSTQGPTSIG